MYILDTDICSYILKQRPVNVLDKFAEIEFSHMAISIITVAELLYGVRKKSGNKINISVVNKFISNLQIIKWDVAAAEEYAKIRSYLEKKGKTIGNMDMMIAACAVSIGAVLVSNNTRHFINIPNLKVENWV
ncbi:MAG: type II toxin-antitoxin system VapC family toxin [Rickettsiales bacterium]